MIVNCKIHGEENRDERFALLDQQISAGWGSVPGKLIPPNWRELEPPHQYFGGRYEETLQLELALA